MNRKYFIIPATVIIVIISLIIFLIPIKTQNETGFIITYAYYLLFNIISLFLIYKNVNSDLKKDVLNISTIYIYVILNILSIIILVVSRIIFVNTNIITILILVLALVSFLILFFLIKGNKAIINQEEKIKSKTESVNNWKTKIEIFINDCDDNSIKKELKDLYEVVRYMDPISNEVTKELDLKIDMLLGQLEKKADINLIKELYKIVNERKVLISNNK